MNEMLDKNDLKILIKVLNWNPKCIVPNCLIPCKHAGEPIKFGPNEYFGIDLCCAHWEMIFEDTVYACEICDNVYWWAGKIMTRDEPNPSLDAAMNTISELIMK